MSDISNKLIRNRVMYKTCIEQSHDDIKHLSDGVHVQVYRATCAPLQIGLAN